MRYRTIVCDPPWTLEFGSTRTMRGDVRRGKWNDPAQDNRQMRPLPYASMTVAEIAALPVAALAERDAHLYVWTVNRYVRDTYDIVSAWGFRPAQLLTWCKAPMGEGLGGAFTPTTEHVLFARRGTLPAKARVDTTWWLWRRGKHSAKPEAFLDLVEAVSPGPYLEMFSRRARLGWDVHGDESLGHVDLGAA